MYGACKISKGAADFMGLDLWMVVRHYPGSRNQTWMIYKNNKGFCLLRHASPDEDFDNQETTADFLKLFLLQPEELLVQYKISSTAPTTN